jgi:hypothetical protein
MIPTIVLADPLPRYCSGTMTMIGAGSLIIVYLIVGMSIRRYKFEHRGLDIIPQRWFWAQIPGLIGDGFSFTWFKVTTKEEVRFYERL